MGAELALTYLNDKSKKYVEPFANAVNTTIFLPMDVTKEEKLEAVFTEIEKKWGKLDFLIHSIAFAPKEALHGRVIDVTNKDFTATLTVSCWSFLRMAKLAEPLMKDGGTWSGISKM